MLKKIKNKSAFTLLEIIIAVVILTISIGGIYSLSVQTKKKVNKSEYSITAMYLAQEGLEFVRNIRDEKISKSYNRENGWDKFLTDDLGFGGIGSGGYLVKNLEIGNNGEFKLVDSQVNFDKKVSSLDDICGDVWDFTNCYFEHINIENLGNLKNEDLGKNFFRRIKVVKKFGEKNLITVYSEIFWEDHGNFKNFISEQKLGNIAIN